jgi:MFS family permease
VRGRPAFVLPENFSTVLGQCTNTRPVQALAGTGSGRTHLEVDSVTPNTQPGASSLPAGIENVFVFAIFNALSFQIVLGSPMVLYAKSLDASATVLGIIAGMMPLLVIFQIPAANHVARIGYKRFVFAGWWTRVMFIFAMAVIPLTGGFLESATQLVLMLFLLFCFNLSRGISSAAWLPWITALVPLEVRGRYLAREAGCVHIASFLSLALAAFSLGRDPRSWQFAVLFGFSAIAGMISLSFLKRIPEVQPPEAEVASAMPVPWREIASYGPFHKLLRMVVAWSVAYGGLGAFTVDYLKTEAAMGDGSILLVMGLAFLGGLAGLGYFESRTDRLGSKPVVTFCLIVWVLIMLGWFLLSAEVLQPKLGIVLVLELFMGFAYALVNMNNTRLAMALVPPMGRSHFFALYSVVANLTLGLSPVLWGLVIDAFGSRRFHWPALEVNRFSFFFLCVLAAFVVALVFCRRIDEPKARDMDELISELLQSPQKLWLRLWPRG